MEGKLNLTSRNFLQHFFSIKIIIFFPTERIIEKDNQNNDSNSTLLIVKQLISLRDNLILFVRRLIIRTNNTTKYLTILT